MDHSFEEARNMKLLLTAFEKMSSLMMNYHKSELFCFGEVKEVQHEYMNIFRCNVGEALLAI